MERVLELLRLELSVIPLRERSKEPALPRWEALKNRCATEAEAREWFGRGSHNAGIVLGAVSGGLVVIESDSHAAESWCATELPKTPMATRSARGIHRYFDIPNDMPAGIDIRHIPDIPAKFHANGVDIEIKRHGQYVLAPGSIHPSGHVYEEVEPWPTSAEAIRRNVPPFPFELLRALGHEKHRRDARSEPLPPEIGEGSRNDTLYREACRLRRQGWQEREIVGALRLLNVERCHPRLDEPEVDQIARSAARYDPAEDIYPLTDTGNVEFFVKINGESVRYDHGRRQFFVFNGQHYAQDRKADVDRLALDAIRGRQAIAVSVSDDGKRQRALKWAVDSESRARRDSCVRLIEKHPA